jgi:hypothetical protein
MTTRTASYMILALGALLPQVAAAQTQTGRFEDYVFTSPLKDVPKADRDALRKADLPAFRSKYLPLTRVPIRDEDYQRVFNYYCHSRTRRLVYDRDPNKPTYTEGTGAPRVHQSIDFGVSFQNFGKNELINPFPRGAVVRVVFVADVVPDVYRAGGLGNTVELACYLDGDATNTQRNNVYKIQFGHLEAKSIVVKVGDTVQPGQVLGRIGYSGETSLRGGHTHTTYRYFGPMDPFKGFENPTVKTSLLFNQREVERHTNFDRAKTRHDMRLNEKFSVSLPNNALNKYSFTALDKIAKVLIVATPEGPVAPFNVLPVVKRLRFPQPIDRRDDQGRAYTVHRVTFEHFNAAPRPGEWTFVIETERGRRSNKIFLRLGQSSSSTKKAGSTPPPATSPPARRPQPARVVLPR